MKLVSLFSGGKDSTYAALLAKKAGHSIACLLSIKSTAPESFMYHKPNIEMNALSAEAMGLPLIIVETSLGKEEELAPLKETLAEMKKKLKLGGVVTGAVASTYQASRIQKICNDLVGTRWVKGLMSIGPIARAMKGQLFDPFALLNENRVFSHEPGE